MWNVEGYSNGIVPAHIRICMTLACDAQANDSQGMSSKEIVCLRLQMFDIRKYVQMCIKLKTWTPSWKLFNLREMEKEQRHNFDCFAALSCRIDARNVYDMQMFSLFHLLALSLRVTHLLFSPFYISLSIFPLFFCSPSSFAVATVCPTHSQRNRANVRARGCRLRTLSLR